MILIQQNSPDSDTWVAVHCESLTLVEFIPLGEGDARVLPFKKPSGPLAVISHPEHAADRAAAIRTIQREAGHRPWSPETPVSNTHKPLPEWILLNSKEGTTPAVMHTTDPLFIALADPATAVLRAPEFYQSSVDLTPEGWAYWWEDAQRAFESLTIEHLQEIGINVPEAIRKLV